MQISFSPHATSSTFFRDLFLITLCLLASLTTLRAQTFRISTNDQVDACDGNFVDAGSLVGPHSVGTDQIITICSESTVNTHVRVTFETLFINGTLTVYNDDNADDPNDIIATYTSDDSGSNPIIFATAANTTGCLTFTFLGDAADVGWNGIISCQRACQPVIATLFDTDPTVEPADTGYIDVCPFDTVTFFGGGVYPEDGLVYDQDDATSTLEWFFTDGFEAPQSNVIQRVFTEPGGYILNLKVTDVEGCESLNAIQQRIRVSGRPTFNLQDDIVMEVCANDTIAISGSTEINPNTASNVFVDSDSIGFPASLSVADTTFLPDGNDEMYQSTLTFNAFSPGATLTSLDDLIGICMNMEHSYAGDLDLYIECPNGSQAVFIDFTGPGLGGQYFGIPVDIDADLSPGVGYDYCFIPDPSLLSISEHAIMNGTDANGSIAAGNYTADSDAEWDNLIGCPLNGDWILRIQDNLFSDNGYIFSWSIEFDAQLYPDVETFFVGIEDQFWVEEDNIFYYEPDTIAAVGELAGNNYFSYAIIDSFGCYFDTTVIVQVLPLTAPDCYECQPILDQNVQDAVVCTDSELQTTLASSATLDTLIAWGDYARDTLTNERHNSIGTAYQSVISVTDMSPATIGDAATTIQSICVDIETARAGDIRIFLRSPLGALLELSSGNGGNDPNYTGTCFTPTATTSITDGNAPFTGTFLPEADLSFLNGSPLNGDWTLLVYDVAGGTEFGRFLGWRITFLNQNTITYSWAPDDGSLSCTDCPDPIITVSAPGTYTVTATDAYGCTETGEVNITLGDLPPNIVVDVTQPDCDSSTGSAFVDLDPTAGYQYSWSHGPNTQSVTDLPPGNYTVTISAGECSTTREITIDDSGAPLIELEQITDVTCFGGSDGQIDVNVTGGAGELTFQWDDPNLQVLEDAVFLDAGTYVLVVTDENGCSDNFTATVIQPDSLELAFLTDDVNCNGGNDGSATVSASGGNGGYQYAWETGAATASASDLMAGNYAITVTDQEGCSTVDSITVNEPAAAVSLVIAQDTRGCNGESLNVATVTASGGMPPYEYEWSNGGENPTATNLPAGTNSVTVTDGSGCGTVIEIDLQDLEPITFNLFASSPTCNGDADGALGVNQLAGGAGTTDADYSFGWSTGSVDIIAENLVGGVEYSLTVTDQQGCTGVQTRLLEQPDPVTFASEPTNVSCFGFTDGSIALTDLNGPNLGGFDVQWDAAAGNSTDPTVTDLGAGTYGVVITDSEGCEATGNIVITQPTILEVDLQQYDVSCFGEIDGSLGTAVSGGTPGYTFQWSDGSTTTEIDDLAAGEYSLTLTDANGCVQTRQTTIVQPPEVVVTTQPTAVVCRGDATGIISITGQGGRPPFTYGLQGTGFNLNSQFIGLPAGDYTAFVRDASGCIGTSEVAVPDGPAFTVDLGPDTTIIFGDSIDLSANFSGAVGTVIYAWSGSYGGTLLCPTDSDRDEGRFVSCPTPNALPEFEIDYRLRLLDENGCEAEGRRRVSVRKIRVVEVPTAFTPNGDNENDLLLVHGRPGTNVKRFSVFNRWGELVYEDGDFPVNDPNRGWNGEQRNQPVTGGVYLWQAEVIYEDGSEELLTGQTSLLR